MAVITILPLSPRFTLQYQFCDYGLDSIHFSLMVSTMVSFVSRGHWRNTEGRKGLVFLAPVGSGLLFFAPVPWSLISACAQGHRVVLCGSCMPRAGTPSATSQTWARSSDHFAVALLSRIQHTPGFEPMATPNSVHLPSRLVYLCPGQVFPKPSRQGHYVPTAVPQLPSSICSPISALLPRGLIPMVLHRLWGHHASQLFWCACPTALAHLCPRGLFPGIFPMYILCALDLVPACRWCP